MHIIKHVLVLLVVFLFTQAAFSQLNRIPYNNQQLFLNGSNLAWVNYGEDFGLGTTDTTTMANWMLQMHQHGGNAMRVWLDVEGEKKNGIDKTVTFNSLGYCIGFSQHLVPDLKKVLDIAWQREIGIDICLWGFGMLGTARDTSVLRRNRLLLTDTSFTNAYIRNCLIPMVEALKGHPAILTWEIFNEPEGMSTEFGWSGYQHVQMKYIQQFVNLCAGAIHRTDPSARVTNGAVTVASITDVVLAKAANESLNLAKMSMTAKQDLESWFNHKYHLALTADQIVPQLQKLTANSYNYYSDNRLIQVGGDPLGTLDFYSVHYYTQNGSNVSVITYPASHWNFDKPVVVGEFALQTTDFVPKAQIYNTIYGNGYAGALAWSWSDLAFSSRADMLTGMQSMWDNHRADVDLLGTGGDWPIVSITYPQDGATFPDSNKVTIQVSVTDVSAITSVDIIVSNTLKIATLTSAPYTYTWTNIAGGIYSITAVATNSLGHVQTSDVVKITVGTPPMIRLEAENATRKGAGMTVVNDNTASNNKYVSITSADTNSTITWTLTSVPSAGKYPIAFGYGCPFGSKTQFIKVNGVLVNTLEFTAVSPTTWYEKTINVSLVKDTNTIQMQMSWAWMYLDYLAVSKSPIPEFTLAILQNPIVTKDLDLYAIPNVTLGTNSISANANGVPVAMTLLDASNRVYAGDYQLDSSGTLVVVVSGTDAWGNVGRDTISVPVQLIKATEGGMIASADVRMQVSFPSRTIERDAYIIVNSVEDSKQGNTLSRRNIGQSDKVMPIGKSYQIGPAQLPLTASVTLQFSYSDEEIRGMAKEKLDIARKVGSQWVSLGSEVDDRSNHVTAQVSQLGEYRLQWNSNRVESSMTLPLDYALMQNYPNPFNPETTIRYTLAKGFNGQVVLSIYNIIGQEVRRLVDKTQESGRYTVQWNGTDDHRQSVSSGVYFYRLRADRFMSVNKMLFLK